MTPDAATIRDEIIRQVQARGPDKSICPSEVARTLSPDWHGLMKRIRSEAIALMAEGRIDILRKGRPVQPTAAAQEDGDAPGAAPGLEIKGVIRLRLRP